MKNEVLKVLKYFSFFDYLPSFEEIYTFLPKKTSKKELKRELEDLVKKKIIENGKLKIGNCPRYTLGEYSIRVQNSKFKIQNYNLKLRASQEKLKNWRFKLYIKLLSLFPQIKLVGLSGSIAMMNAKKEDDIDLFIITGKSRLFTARFISIILAKLLGIHRKREKNIKNIRSKFHVPRYHNKVCLNLFFDESNLEVPDFKKNEFVAHEVLQMRFFTANKWVFKFFPNARKISLKLKVKNSKLQFKVKNYLKNFKLLTEVVNFSFFIFNLLADEIEKFFKSLQLYFINRHKTTEIITDFQLWFHPKDFSSRLRKILEFKN